jgi:hypothetical protein
MVSIEVDFDVFKELTARRTSESVTENDVVRRLLGLNSAGGDSSTVIGVQRSEGVPWITKGVSFPHGTEFRAAYKGQRYVGRVEHGALVVNGERFSSPSAAAISITDNPVNGWRFWECLLPGASRWRLIATLRK